MDILSLAESDIRRTLRRLKAPGHFASPLLAADFVTRRLVALDYPDTHSHRWWALGAVLGDVVWAEVNAWRGSSSTLTREDAWPRDGGARVDWLFDLRTLGGDESLRVWSALYCCYFLSVSDDLDLAAEIGVHPRTLQRWLKDGYGRLRARLHQLESTAADAVTADSAMDIPGLVAVSGFIGREREHAALCRLLAAGEVQLLSIVGQGGVGKTRLAEQVARDIAGVFPGGSQWLDLADAPDAATGLAEVQQLACPSATTAESGQRRLLVLDSVEPLLGVATAIGQLVAAMPKLTLMTTSRVPLRLYRETRFALGALPVSPGAGEASGGRSVSAAAALFWAHSPARFIESHTLAATQAADIAAVCARLGGLPLAVELAAEQLDLMPLAALRARLTVDIGWLATSLGDRPARHGSLLDNTAWSMDRLGPGAAWALRRLSVCVGGFDLDLAAILLEDGSELGLELAEIVPTLASWSLVQLDDTTTVPRFVMPEAVRAYGQAELSRLGEASGAQEAHARGLATWVRAGSRIERATSLVREHCNLLVALRWALDHNAREVGEPLWAALHAVPRWHRVHQRQQLLASQLHTDAVVIG